jgi:hypothetical protein
MKKLICFVLLFSNLAMASDSTVCDWKLDITPMPDSGYRYSEPCHLEVGKLVQDDSIKNQQIQDLTQAVNLKTLALKESDQRAQTWNDTAGSLENRLQKVDSTEKTNQWLFFGLGVVTTFLAGYMAAKLIH